MAATRTYLFPESGKIAENIKNDAFLRYRLETVKSVGDELKKTPASQLKYSEFKIFYETGSRQEYELSYFAHRKRLNTFALLALIYGGEYVSCLEDAIWAVLDEYTWALPAHISRDENVSERITHIDLFASETGFTLAEILRLTGGMLSPEVTERAELEIRRRIIEPYLSGRENSWDKIENNWSAVCAGSVGAAFLYLAEDAEINCALPRILKTLECYLAGFGFHELEVSHMLLDLFDRAFNTERHAREPTLADRVRRVLDRHLEKPVRISDVAAYFCKSERTIERAFEQKFGISAYEYLRSQRLAAAARELRSTDELVYVIAARFQLGSSGFFASEFKKCFGMTPNQYRKQRGAHSSICDAPEYETIYDYIPMNSQY